MNVAPWRDVHPGDTGPAVRGLQFLLRQHGFAIATDGVYGPAAGQAIHQFQAAAGLPEDPSVGAVTWSKLVVASGPGDSGEAVKGVQSFGISLIPESPPLTMDSSSLSDPVIPTRPSRPSKCCSRPSPRTATSTRQSRPPSRTFSRCSA